MIDRLAKAISFIFHPIAIPTYSVLVLYSLRSFISTRLSPELKIWVIGTVFLTTIVIPALFIYLFLAKGIIKSGYMESRYERTIPYFITSIFFFLCYYLLQSLPIPQVYIIFMLGASTIVLLVFIINFWYKISIHMSAMGGMLGAFIAVSFLFMTNTLPVLIAVLFCAGIIGSSRLQLKAHHPTQIYVGFGLGFLIMSSMFFLLV